MMRLVAYAAEHVDAVQALISDEAVLAFTPVPEPVPVGHAAGWLERFSDGTAWVVLDGDAVVGFGCAPHCDLQRGEAELGYLVHAAARGRGVAGFALREMTLWAFEKGVVRVELRINHDNAASRRVAERCGYQLEGLLRDCYLKPGRRVDTTIWSRLVSDPNPVEPSA